MDRDNRETLSPDGLGGAGIPAPPGPARIQAFEQKLGGKRTEEWKRGTTMSGAGATHVRFFHSKLSDEGIGYLEQQVNDWLDAHPQCEVKLVSTCVGEWHGKLGKEQHIIVQVWV
ncbi:MAG TPA: hypothetical protein VD971_12360 [Phycisphaerales bacterium]|nr:hypothetical protein [Phycisphaerales bacterium]